MTRPPRYTPEELDQIRRGIVPEGRKRHDVQMKAREMGIDFPRVQRPWTAEEVALLKENKPVPTRTVHQCYNKAWKLKIEYAPKGMHFRQQHALSVKHRQDIIDEVKKTGQIRATGRKYGVSYSTVSEIAKAAGLTNNPAPRERCGYSIEYDGVKYVWHDRKENGRKGCAYWRGTTGKRQNLARVIYEKHNGPIPPGRCVCFKNGDRMDLRPENLELITNAEQMKRQQQNPLVKAAMLAGAAMGRLSVKIKERSDPEYREERRRQRAENCREMQRRRWNKTA